MRAFKDSGAQHSDGGGKEDLPARVAKRGPPAGRQLRNALPVSTLALKDEIFQKKTNLLEFYTMILFLKYYLPPEEY
jgi:hypothetical protein